MKILTIPGIGDIHWVMLKMESFIEKHCPGEKPEIHVWNFDGRPRSGEFVERIPFVEFGGYLNEPLSMDQTRFHKSYMEGDIEYAKIPEFHGFDYYLCVNGMLRVGAPWNSILPQYKTNWNYEIKTDDCIVPYKDKYIMFYFSDHGMFKNNWTGPMDAYKIKRMLDGLKKWGYKLVLTGSDWDRPFNEKIRNNDPDIINTCGETSLAELLGLIKGASAFVGWCGGNTIIAQHLGTPTYMLWSNYFKREFQTNWVDPNKINKVYKHLNVEQFKLQEFYDDLERLIERNKR